MFSARLHPGNGQEAQFDQSVMFQLPTSSLPWERTQYCVGVYVIRARHLRETTDVQPCGVPHYVPVIGNDPAPKWIESIALVKELTDMNGTLDLQFADGVGVDRELAFALVAESVSEADRAFGHTTDGRLLERYALEAAIDLLSRPAKVLDFMPALAVREVRQSLAAR